MSTISIENVTIDYLNTDQPVGVEKRLAAALRSVARRGSVEWSQHKLSDEVEENQFTGGPDHSATFQVAIASSGGEWKYRAYWFQGTIELSQDAFGVLAIWASNAQITVVNDNRTEATRFAGNGAEFALAQAYRQVVLRDLGLAAATGWETGQRDSLVYDEWATALQIREETPPTAAEISPSAEEPTPQWELDLVDPLA